MDQHIRASAEFDASHIDPSWVRCQRTHGHHWTVTAEKRFTSDPANLEVDLHAIVAEWQNRDLCEMLHVPSVTHIALASLVMERLLLRHPTLVRVEVGDGSLTAIVVQESRR